jgi:hypothetical protein
MTQATEPTQKMLDEIEKAYSDALAERPPGSTLSFDDLQQIRRNIYSKYNYVHGAVAPERIPVEVKISDIQQTLEIPSVIV